MTIPLRITESRPQPLKPTHAVILYEGAGRALATLHTIRLDGKSSRRSLPARRSVWR